MHSVVRVENKLEMQKLLFDYSLKNIGLPSQDAYRKILSDKVENVVRRMRWKAHFFQNGSSKNDECKFGLKSKTFPSHITEMKKFEDDLIDMIETIKFKKVNNQFLDKLSEDVRKVNTSNNVFIFADKTKNIYETTPENYNKILRENVTKTYKLSDENIMDTINEELYNISKDLSIEDRIETMRKLEAFITIKDHVYKESFKVNPKYRLINPAKRELGKVSKIILDNINDTIRTKLKVNQWKNTQSVIEWFNNISNKAKYSFLTFDITELYPSIYR